MKKPVRQLKTYRKLSVPTELSAKIDRVAKKLGYKERGGRWLLLDRVLSDLEKEDRGYHANMYFRPRI